MKRLLTDFINLFFHPEELNKDEPEEISLGKKLIAVGLLVLLIAMLVFLQMEGVSMM